MGIYNCERTLVMSIESIINQTFKDWELIMCDDGSFDNTFSIAAKYANKHDNIILVKNDKNMGLIYTLNKCLELVKGEYIARQDGDDISLPTRLEKEVNVLDTNPEYSIISTAMMFFDENGVWGISNPIKEPHKEDFVKGTPFCHAPCMVRKKAFDDVKGYTVDKKLLRVEDYHLWFKMYSKGCRGYNIKEPLYKMLDDKNANRRRKYRYRIYESYVKYLGFRMLDIPYRYYIYILRPLFVGLLPKYIYNMLRKRRDNKYLVRFLKYSNPELKSKQ